MPNNNAGLAHESTNRLIDSAIDLRSHSHHLLMPGCAG
jgi:hypothetical protein